MIRAVSTPIYDVPYRATPTLEDWSAVTAEEIHKLIGSAPNKTCELDPAPRWLVKDKRRLLSPFISLLFSKSLTLSIFWTYISVMLLDTHRRFGMQRP